MKIAIGASLGGAAFVGTILALVILKKTGKLCFADKAEKDQTPEMINPYLENGGGDGSKTHGKLGPGE